MEFRLFKGGLIWVRVVGLPTGIRGQLGMETVGQAAATRLFVIADLVGKVCFPG